jgi:hypothetical protein
MLRGLKEQIMPAIEEPKMTPSPGQCLELDQISTKRIGPLATRTRRANRFSKQNNPLRSLAPHPMTTSLETKLKAKFDILLAKKLNFISEFNLNIRIKSLKMWE